MIIKAMLSRFPALRFTTSSISKHAETGGIPGSNLPFGIDNKFKLTALFIVFFGSGAALPSIAVRHHMLK